MRNFFLFLSILLSACQLSAQAFSVSWSLNTNLSGTSSSTLVNPDDAAFAPGMINPALVTVASQSAYQAEDWTNASTVSTAEYLEISINTDPGFALSSGSSIGISFSQIRGTQGPKNYEVHASTDGFATSSVLGSGTSTTTWAGTGSFSQILAQQATAIAFRIYGFNSQSLGSSNWWAFNNIQVTGAIALPVTLSDFSARPIGIRTVQLEWSSAQERNTRDYVIERSTDGRSFEAIGQTPAAGNSDAVQSYRFNDEQALQGRAYYRLRMRDLDEKEAFSPVQSVRIGSTNGAIVYPFQVSERLHVQLDQAFAQDGSWQVFSLQGQNIASGVLAAEQQTFTFEAASWPKGAYVLHLFADGNQISKIFEKN
jgi:hypothetical protein